MVRQKKTLPVVACPKSCCWCGRYINPEQRKLGVPINGIRAHSLNDLEPRGKCVKFELPHWKKTVVGYLAEKDSETAKEKVETEGTDIIFLVCSLGCKNELLQGLIPIKIFSESSESFQDWMQAKIAIGGKKEDKKKSEVSFYYEWWKKLIKEKEDYQEYFTPEMERIVNKLSGAMSGGKDPRSVLKMILLEFAFYWPAWITRDPKKEGEITLSKRPKKILNIKVAKEAYYLKLIAELSCAAAMAYGGLSEGPEDQSGLEEIVQRLSEAFFLYLEKEEKKGKIILRLRPEVDKE